jgi:tetratricopeptide (TPR) repeat protein
MKRALAFALALALFARAETDDDLVARLGSDSWNEREAATLACLERPGAKPLLETAAAGADPERAMRARWILRCLDWGVSADIARSLGNPFDGFQDMSDEELCQAVDAVRRVSSVSRTGLLITALRRLPDGNARLRARLALAEPPEGGVEWARARLDSSDREFRVGAALALSLWKNDAGLRTLEEDLRDAPLFGRRLTLDAIAGCGDAGRARAVGEVARFVKGGGTPEPGDVEILSLARAGDAAAEETLLQILETEWGASAELSGHAAAALARRASPAVAPRLAAWWEKDPEKRMAALKAAAAVADKAALDAFAAKAAEKIGGEDATPDQLAVVATLQRLAGRKEDYARMLGRLLDGKETPTALEGLVEAAVGGLEAGETKKVEAFLKRHADKGGLDGGLVLLLQQASGGAGGTPPMRPFGENYNNESWEAVTHPESLFHPGYAVRLSEHTCKFDDDFAPRGTLGAAYYRAGRFEDAIRTLERNVEPWYANKEEDMAFLVMAYVRSGRLDDAKKIEAKCREWEERTQDGNPLRPEMERVLEEAAAGQPGDGQQR